MPVSRARPFALSPFAGRRAVARPRPVEWPTVALLAGCYAVWAAALWGIAPVALWAAIPVAAVAAALHSSLSHEAIHGHPTSHRWLNAALVWPALVLVFPYARFRDTHLAHHHDAILTDPYDDPETNYLDPGQWSRLGPVARAVLRANNTLAGRLTLGPVIGVAAFVRGDIRLALAGDGAVIRGWLAHLPAALAVIALVAWSPMPAWAYALAVWIALGILKIRTFLEHQAHERAPARTVIVEDRGPLSWLFLNNNLHVVHHMHPRVPWYRLPALYAANPARYLGRNGGYRYDGYWQVFARHFWRAKDPVAHPLWRR